VSAAARPAPATNGETAIVPAPRTSAPSAAAVATPSTSATPTRASAGVPVEMGEHCRYCGGDLPPGRRIVFCPHCGQNLTVVNCMACGTELELGWKFCTTCGRPNTTTAG
jgi:predicted amidophosphoribosyltransferase